MNLNFKAIAAQLLKALRGDLSQRQIGKILRLNANQIAKWETATNRIPWLVFIEYCDFQGRSVQNALFRPFGFVEDSCDSKKVIKILIAQTQIAIIAKAIGVSVPTVSRWLSGVATPTLDQVLRVIYFRNELLPFIKCLCNSNDIHELLSMERTQHVGLELFVKYPEAPALHCMFQSDSARANYYPGQFAKILKISLEREREVIEALCTTGMLRKDGKNYIAIDVSINTAFSAEATFEMDRSIKAFWLTKCRDILLEDSLKQKRCAISYRFLAVSAEKELMIRQEIGASNKRLIEIIEIKDGHPVSAVLAIQKQILKLL